MDFTLLPQRSALRKFWSPKLTFTGVSIMGVNPSNGVCSGPSCLGPLWPVIAYRYLGFCNLCPYW